MIREFWTKGTESICQAVLKAAFRRCLQELSFNESSFPLSLIKRNWLKNGTSNFSNYMVRDLDNWVKYFCFRFGVLSKLQNKVIRLLQLLFFSDNIC